MKAILFLLAFCFSAEYILGQNVGDYRTRSLPNPSGYWNAPNMWEVFYNGGWQKVNESSAGPYLNITPSSTSGQITIQGGNLIRITAPVSANQLVIQSGALLIVNPDKVLTIVDDFVHTPLLVMAGGILRNTATLDLQSQLSVTSCIVNGVLESSATLLTSNPELLLFNGGSVYKHLNGRGGNIPLATWDNNSTCLINGLDYPNNVPPGNLSQPFGNFTWHTPGLGGSTTPFSLGGGLKIVNGDLRFVSTYNKTVRLNNGGEGSSLTIGGNFIIEGGSITVAESQSSTTSIYVGGNIEITGGTLTLGTSNNFAVNLYLKGSLQKTAGTLTRGTGTGTFTILGYSATSAMN